MNEFDRPKPLVWVGSTRRDYRQLPEEAQAHLGYALHVAQTGDMHDDAKPLAGFGGAGVVEIVSDHGGSAFRCVYTVRLPSAVYVLHVFQKKSKRGIKTPKVEIDLVKQRLRVAEVIEKGDAT